MPGLPEHVYAAAVPGRAIAGFAADVGAEAAAGDVVARRIIREAAHELALSACTALERLFDPGEAAAVSYAGNVFLAGPVLLEPFENAVRERRPETEVVAPEGDSLAGAALLAGRAQDLRPERGLLWIGR